MVIHVRVPIESFILEKVLKFAQQFFRPGKSLENGDKVWKDGIKSLFFICICLVFYLPRITRLQLQKDTKKVRRNGKDT